MRRIMRRFVTWFLLDSRLTNQDDGGRFAIDRRIRRNRYGY